MANKKRGPGRPPGSKNKSKKGKKSTVSGNVKKNVQKKEMHIENKAQIRDEVLGIVIVAVGIFLVIAMQTHAAGVVGEAISDFLKGMFGFVAFLLPYCCVIYGALLFFKKTIHIGLVSIIYLTVIYLAMDLINAARFLGHVADGQSWGGFAKCYNDGITLEGGGVFGMGVGSLITDLLGIPGLYIVSFALIIVFLLLLINTPVSRFFEKIKFRRQRKKLEREERAKERRELEAERYEQMVMEMQDEEKPMTARQKKIMGYVSDNTADTNPETAPPYATAWKEPEKYVENMPEERLEPEITEPAIIRPAETVENTVPVDVAEPVKITKADVSGKKIQKEEFIEVNGDRDYEHPPIELLNAPVRSSSGMSDEMLREKAALLEDTLASFKIDAKVTNVVQGPTVTRFEVHPNSGVKVSKIKNLINDIALNMAAKSIRIEAPIPGKRAVGIEIENEKSKAVTLREIIESPDFRNAKSKISFAVGTDIGGKSIVGDLASMPHLLIAGATGSGKSVCINSIIMSILYKARPEEVKMVLIDPKIVELSDYNGIPHLLIPVVTDAAKAAAALNWAVTEMDERYKKFAENGVRDFASFNRIKASQKNRMRDGEVDGPIPQIVIIIDELADLMMVASSQVEDSICRLAQKARAAGMHLIVATQRPSVNVITGTIKANIPSRIAFAVTSQVDSRTVLDMVGAERLVGKGDMLFAPIGSNKPLRVQGTFVTDQEVKNVIEFVQKQGEADEAAEADVLDTIERANTPDADKTRKEDEDEFLPEAIELVVDSGSASTSMLQRRFRIGYNRAARMIDAMEERQIIGPPDGSRPRAVLISPEDLENMKDNE